MSIVQRPIELDGDKPSAPIAICTLVFEARR